MKRYIALLRGVNVGGKNRVVMSELKLELSKRGLLDVSTYINSGNIMFTSECRSTTEMASTVSQAVSECSGVTCDVVVISSKALQKIVARAPQWWGEDASWKHNLLFIIPPATVEHVVHAIGELKPRIEAVEAGKDVIYQSMSFDQFGKTTTGKLASNPVYKQITIRNYNTVVKLAKLVQTD